MSVLSNFEGLVDDVFIETGTGAGDTLHNATHYGFNDIYSIEQDELLAREAVVRFLTDERVVIFRGSSPKLLPKVIDPYRATTFWLDAHWAGGGYGETFVEGAECPLMEELKIINSYLWVIPPKILIDDVVMFRNDGGLGLEHDARARFDWSQWPTISEIEDEMSGYDVKVDGLILRCTQTLVDI